MAPRLTAIILAAGMATRFGRNKLLERVDGDSIISLIVKRALASKVDDVLVVLGHDAERVREELRGLGCAFVYNPDYRGGQSTSVKAGIREARGKSNAILILLGDMPFITPGSINAVIDEYLSSGAPLVVATYCGRWGHPLLLDESLFEEAMNITEEGMGLKQVLMRHKGEIREVEVGEEGILVDIDTQEDFRRLMRR